MNIIGIPAIKSTINVMEQYPDVDVLFYSDYSLHINKDIDDETTISGKKETEYFSHNQSDMEALTEELYEECRNDLEPVSIDIDEWPQLYDDSLEITCDVVDYDQDSDTLECLLESSDGTYVHCYIIGGIANPHHP